MATPCASTLESVSIVKSDHIHASAPDRLSSSVRVPSVFVKPDAPVNSAYPVGWSSAVAGSRFPKVESDVTVEAGTKRWR